MPMPMPMPMLSMAMPMPHLELQLPLARQSGGASATGTPRLGLGWVGWLRSAWPSLRIKCVGFRINYAARMRQQWQRRRRRRSKPEIDVAAFLPFASPFPLPLVTTWWWLPAFNNIATNQYIIWPDRGLLSSDASPPFCGLPTLWLGQKRKSIKISFSCAQINLP